MNYLLSVVVLFSAGGGTCVSALCAGAAGAFSIFTGVIVALPLAGGGTVTAFVLAIGKLNG
jgi:hypothetical protein